MAQDNEYWQVNEVLAARKLRLFHFFRFLIAFSIIAFVLLFSFLEEDDAKTAAGFIVLFDMAFLLVCGSVLKKLDLHFLMLRPFNEENLTPALKYFVVKNIGKYGHVYTLSDKNYRSSRLLNALEWIGSGFILAFSPFIFNSPRLATIKRPKSIPKLEKFLHKAAIRLSVLSFVSGGQALNIRSSDTYWKETILLLLEFCDIIVVDLSRVKEGTDWELNQIVRLGLFEKCLFIISDQAPLTLELVAPYVPNGSTRLRVYSYSQNGELSEPTDFQASLQLTLSPSR